MPQNKLLANVQKNLKPIPLPFDNDPHSRYTLNDKRKKSILVDNITYLFTCDENDRLIFKKNHSIIIENGVITDIVPAKKIIHRDFDLIYDAGKRGGTVVTPGLINAHSHIHMYLLRSAMLLDEEESVDQTIAAMAVWQQSESEDSYTYASIGDLTEQQKSGVTTTLTHGPSFQSADIASRVCGHNLMCAVSAVSNSRPTNTPEMVEKIIKQKDQFHALPAIALHYLYKTPLETLEKVKRLIDTYGVQVTFHMAESPHVVQQTRRIHGMGETQLMKMTGLLNQHSIASHVLYVTQKEIEQLARHQVGIVHLPTSNVIHQSGLFPYWQFSGAGGFPRITLGTDSVVSKNRLDLLTEAYQTRITHLYSHTIKYGSLFKMMTANAARVLGMNDRGKILPGMKADLVFWKLRDRGFIPFDIGNPPTLLGNMITHGGRMVRDLMVSGNFVVRDRRHQLINETELLSALQKKHMQMRRRVQEEHPELIQKKTMAKPHP